jgi:putative chitinase
MSKFTFDFTADQFKQIIKNKESDAWFTACYEILPKYDITTPERVASFLSQCGHESADFTATIENLNYGAKGLLGIFKKYFPSQSLAESYERKPEKIANRVYADRMGNGPESSGDGWKYRGKGLIQLTGKDNHSKFAKSIDKSLDEVLDYLLTKEGALESACWFWKDRKINAPADKCDTTQVTKLVNGGTHGLEDRQKRFNNAMSVFGGKSAPVAATKSSTSYQTIKKGSKNDTVKAVQEALGLAADGIFGAGTEKAVKDWQAKNGLDADGIAGPATLKKLLG